MNKSGLRLGVWLSNHWPRISPKGWEFRANGHNVGRKHLLFCANMSRCRRYLTCSGYTSAEQLYWFHQRLGGTLHIFNAISFAYLKNKVVNPPAIQRCVSTWNGGYVRRSNRHVCCPYFATPKCGINFEQIQWVAVIWMQKRHFQKWLNAIRDVACVVRRYYCAYALRGEYMASPTSAKDH